MKLCGIIAEFNPLTNGHAYIMRKAKEITGLDICVIMSGNIVQRGELAILDKYTRAKLAINAGASLVVELPTAFALSSAEYFSKGAVSCLKDLPISHLAFGVETDNIDLLIKFAKLRANEPTKIKSKIKELLKEGNHYSVALYNAYKGIFSNKDLDELFKPNNILACEYLSAIYSMKLDITPVFIRRTDNGFSSNVPLFEKKIGFLPASQVREKAINSAKDLKLFVSGECLAALSNINTNNYENSQERLSAILISSIRSKSVEELKQYYDYSVPLASKIKKAAETFGSVCEIVESLTSKNLRSSRIKRLLFFPYLGIKKGNYNVKMNALAVSRNKKDILKECSLVVSTKDALMNQDNENLRANQRGSDLFQICYRLKSSKDKAIFV